MAVFGRSQQQRDAPRAQVVSDASFSRRAIQSSVVIGDYLYIDGGEWSTTSDDVSFPLTSTLSLPLRTSWTNVTVPIRSITPHPAPVLNLPILWVDESEGCFYQWGGYFYDSHSPAPKAGEVWKFCADNLGGGEWARSEGPSDATIIRTSSSLTVVADGVGYTIGGIPTDNGNRFPGDPLAKPLDGMVSYDFSSNTWTRESTEGYSASGTAAWGMSVFAPSFGSRGLIITMGGGISDASSGEKLTWLPFDRLKFYDVDSKKWYEQKTTGEAPSPRTRFCIVGVEGPNETHEIYLYGGHNEVTDTTYNDLYVLSMPGFVWRKGPSTPDLRSFHSCNLVGQRQMLVVGGNNWGLGWPADYQDPDPNVQGLSIFDLTNMEWASSYDAEADPYESPQVIQDWYSQADPSSVEWTSNEVRDLFIDSRSKLFPSGGDDSSAPTSTPSAAASESSTPVGSIVGGVIGGVVALCVIIGLLFFLRRRRQRRRQGVPEPGPPIAQYQHNAELPGDYGSGGAHGPWGAPPAKAVVDAKLLDSAPRYELDPANDAPVELYASNHGFGAHKAKEAPPVPYELPT